MSDRPKTPRDLARRRMPTKQASLYAAADSFAQRAKLSENDTERKRWAKAAAYYRELARIEEDDEGAKPPAPKKG
jgi:hypothetical protein